MYDLLRAAPRARLKEAKLMIVRSAVVVLVALTFGASACVEDDTSFYIKGMRAPDTKCTTPAPGGTTFIATGKLDVSVKLGYYAFPEVLNALTSSTSNQPGQPEAHILQMRGYRISLDMGEIPGSFSADLVDSTFPTSGTIQPAGAMTTAIQVIRDPLAAQLATTVPKGIERTIYANVRAVATMSGGEKESALFVFPIIVCNGCLVDFLTGRPCPAPDESMDKFTTNTCGLPQDAPVTCCNLANSATVKCLSK